MGNSAFKGDDRYAFNVVDVRPQSPGQRCGLMPFHDFILSVNGNMLNNMDKDEIVAFINESENTHVKLRVFNRARSDTREVTMFPTRKWPGDGLLGITIRLEKYMDASHAAAAEKVGRRRSESRRSSDPDADFAHTSRNSNDVEYDDIYKFESPLERRKSFSGAGRRPSLARGQQQQQQFLGRTSSVNAAARARLDGPSMGHVDSTGEEMRGQDSPLRRARSDLLGSSNSSSAAAAAVGGGSSNSNSNSSSSSGGGKEQGEAQSQKVKKPLSYRLSRTFVRTVTLNPKPRKQQNI